MSWLYNDINLYIRLSFLLHHRPLLHLHLSLSLSLSISSIVVEEIESSTEVKRIDSFRIARR